MEISEERVYQELKDLNENYNSLNVSNVRGEEELKGIRKEFKTLNGSVKKHAKKIWWIEKVLWVALGIFGAVQFYLNYFN